MSDANLINTIGIIVTFIAYSAALVSLAQYIRLKKTQFTCCAKYFGHAVTVENYHFNNKRNINKWILNLEYVYIPILGVIPATFAAIYFASFTDVSWLWMIGYLSEYFLVILLILVYLKKTVLAYANTIPETKYDYDTLKQINIPVIKDYRFEVLDHQQPIMRNHAFQHNFKVFAKRYHAAANNSFKQYKILLNILNRFASLINTMEVEHNWSTYMIKLPNKKLISYTKQNFIEQVLLATQSIINH